MKITDYHSPLHETIIDCLDSDYGIKAVKLTLLSLGADENASVYKAEGHDHSIYFIKLKHGVKSNISAAITSFLYQAGIQHIIPPIKNIYGESYQYLENHTITVFPFIEGQNAFERKLTPDQWVTLGKVLRQIHEIELTTSIKEMIRWENYSAKWREIVLTLYNHIDSSPSTDDISSNLKKFMIHHSQTIHRLINRAEVIGKQLQRQSKKYVLCHSDIHGGNVLIDNNNMIYIVDWDDPIIAPKERDLMFIGGGIANVWNEPQEEKFFYKGYGQVYIDKSILAYYRQERIVEDVAVMGQQLLLSAEGGQNRATCYQHFIAQFEPRGVIDIAINTDDSLSSPF